MLIPGIPETSVATVQAHFQDEKYPPQVHPDGRVTFRLKAPLAQKVQIEPINGQPENNGYNGLGKAPYDMTQDEDGLWSVTTPPAVPGLHGYWLVVDGVRVNDTATKSLWRENANLRCGSAGTGGRFLRYQGCAAWPGAHAVVLLEGYQRVAAGIRLYTPGYDTNFRAALPGLHPAPRRRGRRDRLGGARSRQFHPRQFVCAQARPNR